MPPVSSLSMPRPSGRGWPRWLSMAPLLASLLALGLAACPGRASERREVSDAAGLMAALKAAQGGETIVLAPGDYGALGLNGTTGREGRFTAPVTIASASPQAAHFTGIRLSAVTNLTFDGITLEGPMRTLSSQGIAIIRSRVKNREGMSLSFRATNGVMIEGNHITGGDYGVNFYSVADFRIIDNLIEKAASDLIQISRASYNGLIENNVLHDVIVTNPKAHPDLIQIFGYDGLNPHDITIRGNYLYDDPATGLNIAQGIFMAGPQQEGFRNMLVEENLVSVRSPNSIFISGGQENVVIRHNSLIAGPERLKGGTIRLKGKKGEGHDNSGVTVENNIAAGIIDETRSSQVGRNFLYGSFEKSPFSGSGARWQDFILRRQPSLVNAQAGANDTLKRFEEGHEGAGQN
ncbi:right-handed parallel beta-helix repeat-containing protein [Haematobacter missouriensis]|nr:right-handed parallel beta-helix repeat-containing protein [Haematobacter missouriensis]